MLFSPEYYYEQKVQGRSVEEVTSEIQKLRREIAQLKEELEDPASRKTLEIKPSRALRINIYRQYLERARDALEEAGGCYQPTRTEIAAHNFDRYLPSIRQITLTLTDSQGTRETRSLDLRRDELCLLIQRSGTSARTMATEETMDLSREEFLDRLSELHIGEWRSCYRRTASAGDNSWILEIEYSDAAPMVRKSGHNAQPYNFHQFLRLMDIDPARHPLLILYD